MGCKSIDGKREIDLSDSKVTMRGIRVKGDVSPLIERGR